VIAILGGLGAAAAWATSTLCSARSSRLIDPPSVAAWVLLVGLLISGPAAVTDGIPHGLGGPSGGWLALAGAGNVAGLVLAYGALRGGPVTLIAPLISTEGAVAALIALSAGESLSPSTAAALAVVASGIFLATVSSPAKAGLKLAGARRPVLLAVAAAVSFGVSLYATARAGAKLPSAWVVLSARAIGAVVVALPLVILGRLRLTRDALPLVVTSGLCEVLGFYSYTAGSRHGIAVAAVLSSQFAALAALGGYLLFKERLGRVQLAGVLTVLVGVAFLGGLQA
jgi:drug/metabolite transporter (DMT)-like permease